MATYAQSGLFPPMIQTYLPAFDLSDVKSYGLTINYSLSDYNIPGDIKSVHVSIVRQSNYESLFKDDLYPLGIYVYNFPNGADKTQITIPFGKFNTAQFNYNEYYKVQVRLSKQEVPSNSLTGENLSVYLNSDTNMQYFSEWSTVCLIRFIAPFLMYFKVNNLSLPLGPDEGDPRPNSSSIILTSNYTKGDLTDINDAVNNGKNDNEYLSNYQVILLDNGTEVFDSGIIDIDIVNNDNIYYPIPYYFENNQELTLKIKFTTANLYQNEGSYSIISVYPQNSWSQQSDVVETLAIDSVIGKVNISFDFHFDSDVIPEGAKLTIRRGSDKDNYTIWDTVWTKIIDNATGLSFDDFTIESGVLYKYEITYTKGSSNYVTVNRDVISVFDHAFLTGEGTQLCVKFNPNITNYKVNVSDGITTTIGGQYPYINRNGNMYYRSFSLSGTIAYEMDAEHQFATRSSIYGDYIDIYGTYFVNRYFNTRNDRVTQRKFRELVMNYLYDDVPKLFRSTPEGNVLVRLTDVTLTPNQQLGRMIYDFSCTATEIGDSTIENCKLYQIQDFGG